MQKNRITSWGNTFVFRPSGYVATHVPTEFCRFLYIELYDACNRLVSWIKVMEQDGLLKGCLYLDSHLSLGMYGFLSVTPWGIMTVEFYMSRYKVEKERRNSNPDQRPSLYWNSDVHLQAGGPGILRF